MFKWIDEITPDVMGYFQKHPQPEITVMQDHYPILNRYSFYSHLGCTPGANTVAIWRIKMKPIVPEVKEIDSSLSDYIKSINFN